MSTNRRTHAEILEKDLELLYKTPKVVTPGHVANMQQHIRLYREQQGLADALKGWMLPVLAAVTLGFALFCLGFAGAAILWAREGSHSWGLLALPCIAGPAGVWLFVKLAKGLGAALTARISANNLVDELSGLSAQDWERAQIVRTLNEEATAYFDKITSEGEPMRFQLTALHRMANVLTEREEFFLDELGESPAPHTALYLHQHPNLRPQVSIGS